jgi:hypothetical protein
VSSCEVVGFDALYKGIAQDSTIFISNALEID